MRGKVISTRIASVKVRITPAYAGKSLRACSHKLLPEDHPRLCGEKVPEMLQFSSVAGSPPPMRGKVFASKSKQDGFRITPAYAGKSAAMSGRYQVVTDHPRLCGEKCGYVWAVPSCNGSPPPMRGKDTDKPTRHIRARITPAYAGKRLPPANVTLAGRDHPRLCGEKTRPNQ